MKCDLTNDSELESFTYRCCYKFGILQHYQEALQEARIARWRAKPCNNKKTYNVYLATLIRWHIYQFANKRKGGDNITKDKRLVYQFGTYDLDKVIEYHYDIKDHSVYTLADIVNKTVLTPVEETVLKAMKKDCALEDIGKIIKKSRERARQIKIKVMFKLKKTFQQMENSCH